MSSTLLAYWDGRSTRTSASSKICSWSSLLSDLSSFLKSERDQNVHTPKIRDANEYVVDDVPRITRWQPCVLQKIIKWNVAKQHKRSLFNLFSLCLLYWKNLKRSLIQTKSSSQLKEYYFLIPYITIQTHSHPGRLTSHKDTWKPLEVIGTKYYLLCNFRLTQ